MRRRSRQELTGWGTQRRLQALASCGWSLLAIQNATGIPAAGISAATSDPQQSWPGLDRQVAAAYERLWNQQPPTATRHEQALASAAQTGAQQRNWAPPMAWDDDLIDLPHGTPAPGWKPPAQTRHRSADLVEDGVFVREHCGYRQASMRQVADRLGVTLAVLAKAYERAAPTWNSPPRAQAKPSAARRAASHAPAAGGPPVPDRHRGRRPRPVDRAPRLRRPRQDASPRPIPPAHGPGT